MAQSIHLIDTLKRQLRMHGLTYADVASKIGLSESSVKRLLSRKEMTLARLEQLCGLLGLEVSDLARLATEQESTVRHLTDAQERELVSDSTLLLVAVCVINHWSAARILATYRLTEAECIQYLLKLDKLGLIDLMPGNRVRLRVARDFSWLPGGPIEHFFQQRVRDDFLNTRFDQPGEQLLFVHGMLTPDANARLQQRMRKLAQEFAELHQESTHVPETSRFGSSLLLAIRSWELSAFEALRREPDLRHFPGA
ncbi:transcriptional regulator with XRE-family HTH domain [Chitinivorax tropicus]|uniref:Transcriptional regulator with XRE-family HTH domain n=1 Tax=Chitinivorax tropicus TaxID=714531 RepID=A0A840ML57_9PROT|nr:helix-turn-helix transcriptional regulator [Chitinivorax tropicus]MBB5017286.1 transcriptional regulator with XRE-family HTH domain [Chitinivorax tropicus]